MSTSGTILVDLDGTLAKYDGWQGVDHIGEPIKPMLDRVKEWMKQGITVKIFTARVSSEIFIDTDDKAMQVQSIRDPIEKWCEKHLGQKLPITCVKDFAAVEIWDDRARQVETNTGRLIQDEQKVLREQFERVKGVPLTEKFVRRAVQMLKDTDVAKTYSKNGRNQRKPRKAK